MWDSDELARLENPETMSLLWDAQSFQRTVDSDFEDYDEESNP